MIIDERVWRVGSHYGLHLYAIQPDGPDEPIGTMLTPAAAEQVAHAHNALFHSGPKEFWHNPYVDLLRQIETLTQERDEAKNAVRCGNVAIARLMREAAARPADPVASLSVGDHVRHKRHGGTGHVSQAPSPAPLVGEMECRVRTANGEEAHWYVRNLEPFDDEPQAAECD